MPIQIYDDKILIVDGKIALHEDCCCEEPGLCNCVGQILGATITLGAPGDVFGAPPTCDEDEQWCDCAGFGGEYYVPVLDLVTSPCQGTEDFGDEGGVFTYCADEGGCKPFYGDGAIRVSWNLNSSINTPMAGQTTYTVGIEVRIFCDFDSTVFTFLIGGADKTSSNIVKDDPTDCDELNGNMDYGPGDLIDVSGCDLDGVNVAWSFVLA